MAVLSTIVDWVASVDDRAEEISMTVGGLYEATSDEAVHPRWVPRSPLTKGDEVTIKIVDSDIADEPVGKTVHTRKQNEQAKRRYYEELKKEFEPSN